MIKETHLSYVQNGGQKTWASDGNADQTAVNLLADHTMDVENQVDEKVRVTWSRKAEYVLSMMGYGVGLGNIWRFPYVCIRNGGGAFLIPYIVCLMLCGLPLYFMDVAMGQFMSRGVYHIWSICPLFKGIGVGQIIVNVICAWYYILLIAWVLIYLVHSFRSPLPWTLCGQGWNTPACVPQGQRVGLTGNDTNSTSLGPDNATAVTSEGYDLVNGSRLIKSLRPAGEEFWVNNVLELSSGLDNLDGLPWHTTLALLVACVLVLLCIVKGVKSVGKVVYVTATFPYILLTIFIVTGATLPGAQDGVLFYLKPDFSKLMQVQTWLEASFQVFYSLGPIWGALVTMSSYSKFQNNCMRDSIILTFLCEGTSVYAGFAIFTVLGHMAYNLKLPVESFATSGPGLAFVVYPEAVAYLPVPQLWAVLFFLMLLTVALDSQFAGVEVIMTSLLDIWPKLMRKREVIVKVVFCSVQFLLSLPLASRGGIYLFTLVDWYIAAFATAAIGFLECIIVAWIYGAERFMDDLELMIGRRPPCIFSILWRCVTPSLLLILLVTSLLSYEAPSFEGYHYGAGAVAFGWMVAVVWFLPVPLVAGFKLMTSHGSIRDRLKYNCSPSPEWQPGDVSFREIYQQKTRPPAFCRLPRPPCLQGVSK
nr:sodium- and chloride-dependent glycine transporter 1-like; partial [Biomphalaria glabrata]